MSKAILEFNLDDDHDRECFELHRQAMDMYFAIDNMLNMTRGVLKYGNNENYEVEECITIEKLRDDFLGILDDHGVKLDVLS